MSEHDGDTVARGSTPRGGVEVTIDGTRSLTVAGLTLLGRDPQPAADEQRATIVPLDDPARAMSKTHLALTAHDGQLWAMDRGSVNGSTLRGPSGDSPLAPMQWVHVPNGSAVLFGDSRLAPADAPAVTPAPTPATSPWAPTAPVAAGEVVPPIDRVPSPHPTPPPSGDPLAGIPAPTGALPPIAAPAPAAAPLGLPVVGCTSCGRALQAGDRFCDGCGTPVGSAAAPAGGVPGSTAPAARGPSFLDGAPAAMALPQVAVQSHPTASRSGRVTSRRLLAGVAAAVLAIGAVAFVIVRGGGDGATGASAPGAPAVPTKQPASAWTADVEEATGPLHVGDALYVGSAPYDVDEGDGEVRVLRLAAGDGREEWNTRLDLDYADYVDAVGVIDGTLVVDTTTGDHATIHGLDAETGEVVWDEDGWFATIVGGRLYVGGEGYLEQLDPESGAGLGRVKATASRFTADGRHIVAVDVEDEESEVTVLDATTMDVVVEPIAVGDLAYNADYIGGQVVAAVEDELRFYGADGELERTSTLGVDAIYGVTAVTPDDMIVYADEDTIGVTPTEPRAEERWSVDGSFNRATLLRAGSSWLVPIVSNDDDSATTLVELESGRQRLVVGDEDSSERLGRDAVVSVASDDDGDIDEVTAYAYADGEQLWTFSPSGNRVYLVEDGLVVADDDVITFYR